MTSITAVVAWLNHREYERGFWAAMRAADVEVLVIDNGSQPALPNAWRLEENAGFHRACNLGLELATTDAVLFLNNDIAATEPGWVEPIRAALEPGVLVGASLLYDAHGDVDGMSLPYLGGWCLAGMRDDLLELGGFDEGYDEPAYFGDNDLCLRARAAGMTLREVKVGLSHLENGTSSDDIAARAAASTANRERFAARARDLLGVAA
jgi:GT2 family glycosyltransferase